MPALQNRCASAVSGCAYMYVHVHVYNGRFVWDAGTWQQTLIPSFSINCSHNVCVCACSVLCKQLEKVSLLAPASQKWSVTNIRLKDLNKKEICQKSITYMKCATRVLTCATTSIWPICDILFHTLTSSACSFKTSPACERTAYRVRTLAFIKHAHCSQMVCLRLVEDCV